MPRLKGWMAGPGRRDTYTRNCLGDLQCQGAKPRDGLLPPDRRRQKPRSALSARPANRKPRNWLARQHNTTGPPPAPPPPPTPPPPEKARSMPAPKAHATMANDCKQPKLKPPLQAGKKEYAVGRSIPLAHPARRQTLEVAQSNRNSQSLPPYQEFTERRFRQPCRQSCIPVPKPVAAHTYSVGPDRPDAAHRARSRSDTTEPIIDFAPRLWH